MDFIDFHCDTASLLLELKDKTLKKNDLKVDIEKLKEGNALAQFFALFIETEKDKSKYDKCDKMLNNFKKELMLNSSDIVLCRNYEDYLKAKNNNKIGAFITIEEGEAIEGDINKLRKFKSEGISLMTLTWNFENKIAYPNYEYKFKDAGLKEFGIEVVEEMNNLGMIIDTSHLSDGGFWDVIKYSKYPIVASHSNSRYVCNHSRNLTDAMVKALSNNGGVTGINFCSDFLGESEVSKISDMVKHIKHIKHIGGVDCIALGSDFDGIDNEVEIKDASKMEFLANALQKQRFTLDEIEKIFYKNIERVIREVLK
ncbi:dipeptidase [Clostridium tarantellae]|uniref:Membrane dipeptidase n=1 Tax=Clostridium tarantellae TaxID=39493 RepID=A0A6I1MHG7_9CLOT|nr:dipeptidase [Clostridium tarantellae]MPQ42976.1 membrane dipeptidase [Clostridium tarantellae]